MTPTPAATPPAANDNRPRPAAFDAKLMAHMPGLRRLAASLNHGNGDAAEDLVQDTIAHACANWASYRADGAFWAWLSGRMRHVAQNARRAAATRARHATPVPLDDALGIGVSTDMAAHIDARTTIARMAAGDDADTALVDIGLGYSHAEIAAGRRYGPGRVNQLAHRRRAQMRGAA